MKIYLLYAFFLLGIVLIYLSFKMMKKLNVSLGLKILVGYLIILFPPIGYLLTKSLLAKESH